MGEVSTIGLDIAKSVFQVHGVNDAGAVVMRKRVGRTKVLQLLGEPEFLQRKSIAEPRSARHKSLL